MALQCIVRIPDNISSKTKDLFHHAASNVFQALSGMEKKVERVVAVGHEAFRSLWPGEHWGAIPFDADASLPGKDAEKVLLVGLDAPLLSKNTFEEFLSLFTKEKANVDTDSCLCTFRKTPIQKNPAALMYCGDAIATIQKIQETLTASVRKTDDKAHPRKQDFSITLSNNGVSIKSRHELRFLLGQTAQYEGRYWSKESPQDDRPNGPVGYSENNGEHTLTFSGDCTLHMLKDINSPGLYSKIHYIHTPVTIHDVIGTDCHQTRINLQTGEKISGRQSFPESFEPFLGMIVADAETVRQVLLEGDAWLGTREKLDAFIVSEKESNLISEDSLVVRAGLVQPKPTEFIDHKGAKPAR